MNLKWRHLLVLSAGLEVMLLTLVTGVGLAHILASAPVQTRGPKCSTQSLLQVTLIAIFLQTLIEAKGKLDDRWSDYHCQYKPQKCTNSHYRRHPLAWLKKRRGRPRRCRSSRRRATRATVRKREGSTHPAKKKRKGLGLATSRHGGSAMLRDINRCNTVMLLGKRNRHNQHQQHHARQPQCSEADIEEAPSATLDEHLNLDLSGPHAMLHRGDLCVYLDRSPQSVAGHKCREAEVQFLRLVSLSMADCMSYPCV